MPRRVYRQGLSRLISLCGVHHRQHTIVSTSWPSKAAASRGFRALRKLLTLRAYVCRANSLNLRFAALTDDDAKPAAGLFRDSANAAWLALMYADLPGVRDTRARLARCMALQNVRFILGDNTIQVGGTTGFSFQVGLGCATTSSASHLDAHAARSGRHLVGVAVRLPVCCLSGRVRRVSTRDASTSICARAHSSQLTVICDTLLHWRLRVRRNSYPKNPYSKDAACPPAEVRDAQFEPLFISKNFTGADANANRTRQCDYLTFQGNPMPNPSANGSGPATINPLLPNSFELTGALVSHFKATGGANPYTDQRVLEGGKANGQAQVRTCRVLTDEPALGNASVPDRTSSAERSVATCDGVVPPE